MGNPHAVVFVDDVANFELEKYGPLFENHKMFPKRTNTEFVEILSMPVRLVSALTSLRAMAE